MAYLVDKKVIDQCFFVMCYLFSSPFALFKAFICRFNGLTSAGISTISMGLGLNSTLTYLDISDNKGGLDPNGTINGEGFEMLAQALQCSIKLETLKVARNFMEDHTIEKVIISFQNFSILHLPFTLQTCIGGKST